MTPGRALEALLCALVEPACAVCHGLNDQPLASAVCAECWQRVELFDPLAQRAADMPPLLDALVSAGPHRGTLRRLVRCLKYDRRRSVARPLARLMAEAGHALLASADVVVPVPSHWWRRFRRGFNQTEELARHLGRPWACLLRRPGARIPQVHLRGVARRSNVQGAFALDVRACQRWQRHRERPVSAHDSLLDGMRVLLVDDVATTGATLGACAEVLRAAGAISVSALTAARADLGRRPAPPQPRHQEPAVRR
ncbi:MAG: ComF family protein [Acidobacteria bacterium]|nr:ComF family protein [Acidobacteriota bacterium]